MNYLFIFTGRVSPVMSINVMSEIDKRQEIDKKAFILKHSPDTFHARDSQFKPSCGH